MGLPGVPSSLYTVSNGVVALDLAKMAPASPGWGSQPVWRIAISQDYTVAQANTTRHPNAVLQTAAPPTASTYPEIGLTTHQQSFEQINSSPARTGDPNITGTGVVNIEQHVGNGLQYLLNDPARVSPDNGRLDGFERFIWFTSTRPARGRISLTS